MLLSNFHSIRPPFETLQKDSLEWLAEAHVEAERHKGLAANELEVFRQSLKEKLWRVGCKPDKIAKRGHILKDFLHRDWDKMDVYRLNESPRGLDLAVRSSHFAKSVDGVFEEYYPLGAEAPDDLIHVSCTGYLSPSGAQKIASKHLWGRKTTVTHAYHMGCYGSIPAIRMATGFLHCGNQRVDIVHTEICCLHTNPSQHQLDQLVSQSLFADGFIKYSLVSACETAHLKVLAIQEEIIPDSIRAMTWNVADWGFQMSLAKEVPVLIARGIKEYLKHLCIKANKSVEGILKEALFAVHPGGPKILEHIQELLGLTDAQMAFSFQILSNYGNMSSATLPHIWEAILSDETVGDKTPIVSLAFGPGLTISGALLEKVCGS